MTARFITSIIAFVCILSLHGETDPASVRISKNDTIVDWTAGMIYARASATIPDIASAGGLSRARDTATLEARSRAEERLLHSVSQIEIRSGRTIFAEMDTDEALARKMGDVRDIVREKSRMVAEGNVTVELSLPFKGKSGLLSLTYRFDGSEEIPSTHTRNPQDEITGFLFDASDSDASPVLEPRIYTDAGRLIYGPSMVRSDCYRNSGLATYYSSAAVARKDKRAGENPYELYAYTRPGNQGDIVISTTDAARILSSKTGRASLKRCGVVIVIKGNGK